MHQIIRTLFQRLILFFIWGWMFIVVGPVVLATSGTVSFEGSPAFASQRPCVQDDCFGSDTLGNPYLLASDIGCETNPVENECFCRPDLQEGAKSYLSSCVYSACNQMTLDVNSAIKIYTDYCTNNGFTAATTSSPASTTSGTRYSPATMTVTVVQTVSVAGAPQPTTTTSTSYLSSTQLPTSQTTSHTFIGQTTQSPTTTIITMASGSSNSSSGSSNGNGLDVGGIVGIVVGILGFLATAVGSWFSYKALKNKKTSSANIP
ncbi:hypothetical protein BGW36DRAFT_431383 [Talaromyces proteolyticus]|uniref:Extracellular membrane protein CFEM domain-containing protein n=1 Tax=Talaromyces proteolyticus TaxID=1131652 RepID=A0AAD4PW67_9EURO|nr:uncharacterized protein BGW36DRAFT_431383 [Talaromyces proteolyticus]KAH8692158.1 hypothetical protein BGW36DRAFT_431383 [Talaromyces proteolyticus]